jgi:hypothetical protein
MKPGRRWFAIARRRVPLVLMVVMVGLVIGGLGESARAGARTSLGSSKVRPVPQGFVGVDVDGPMFAPNASLSYPGQLRAMVANGVQRIRLAFDWAAAQPYSSASQVPAGQQSQFPDVGGRPTSFAQTDEMVGDAAMRGITVLPTILYAPGWDAQRNRSGGIDIPARNAPYAQYVTTLVRRYGPNGSFWRAHPGIRKLPVRMWQIWNEPNLSIYWPQPFAPSYVRLLAAAHVAIRRADPGAKLVLGSLTNFAWRSVGQIYHVRGARHLFDVVAINAFTKTPGGVMRYMRLTRDALIHAKDAHKPLLAAELSWPSSLGKVTSQHFDFDTSVAGQARDIAQLLPLIGRQRVQLGLIGFDYYTWIGDENPPHPLAFQFSGLLRYLNGKVTAKPALAAFRKGALALEQCRQPGSIATRCVKRASSRGAA